MTHYPFTLRISTASAVLVEAQAAASIPITHQPTRACYLKVTVSGGQANTGTVTPSGTLDGVAAIEILDFSEARSLLSTNQYDHLDPLVTADLEDENPKPTVKIESVDIAGNPIDATTTDQDYACNKHLVDSQSAMMQLTALGKEAPSLHKFAVEGEVTGLKLGQEFLVVEESRYYKVNSRPKYRYHVGTDLVRSTEFYALEKE